MSVIDGIDLGLVARPAVENVGGGADLAIGAAIPCEQEEFQLERAGGLQSAPREGIDLALQRVAGVGGHDLAVQLVERQEDLGPRRRGVVQGLQRAGDRPGAQVAVALVPDQAGFMHVLATDIEAEDRNRHVPTRFVEACQLVPADDLAAPDAVRIVQHDVDGLNLGMGG